MKMKIMTAATAFVLLLMVMWLPARTPPEVFEETALREAVMLRTGEGLPMPERAAALGPSTISTRSRGSRLRRNAIP